MSRRAICVRGVVQGVGFRPFVFRLANQFRLAGFVRNQTGGVWIEVEGEADAIRSFVTGLTANPPPAARIEDVRCEDRPDHNDHEFRIEPSAVDNGPVVIGPDLATCNACLAELFNPTDRRFRYPFLNCTHCGPRLTIVRSVPYDRLRTTMNSFPMCPACRSEYDDPTNRRFHAQPTACPACGPQLAFFTLYGTVPAPDPLQAVTDLIHAGGIIAVKGLAGFHLACDATNAAVVRELRRRKQRDEKPFAVMVADLAAARELAEVSADEAELLESPRRPIVLIRRRTGAALVAEIAPGNPCVGLMLAYTPLHHLLLRSLERPLVMTSGNRSDEPMSFEDVEAIEHLTGIADAFLTHNRPIHIRCDDSVTRWVAGAELPVRRSRGDAPLPLKLPRACPQALLAVGGQLKSTFALGRGRYAILSHHLGDLDHTRAYTAFTEAIEHYERLFEFQPSALVHDLHPDYASTRYALDRGLPRLAVQHHHAHLASCLAEHGLDEPAIGIAFDGAGYGTDGTVWGGEFLVGDCRVFRRAAHLRPVGMPGGEQAVREPWRMALAHLHDAGIEPNALEGAVPAPALRTALQLLGSRTFAPLTSSIGRLFDAVAAIAGVRQRVSYEGQAAIELEGLATAADAGGSYPFEPTDTGTATQIDCRPLIAAVSHDALTGVPAARIARRFHTTLADIVVHSCEHIRGDTGLDLIALTGGVFQNALFLADCVFRLQASGFRVLRHRRVPPGDGGLCLGQLAVAAATLSG
jgi:hydrogenase maturation protein HypF